jgi:hypothetical protein
MPDVCMWYVVLGMRYEVRGMRYVVQGTRYGTRGTETVCGAPLLTPEISFHQIMCMVAVCSGHAISRQSNTLLLTSLNEIHRLEFCLMLSPLYS